jgi:hypothetical protein
VLCRKAMEQDRPGRDRYPEVEQEGVDQDAAERAGEPLDRAVNVCAPSAGQKLLIRGEHHALSKSAHSVVRR